MRPYRFRIRWSSKRLNVIRPGKAGAAAWRASALFSLGSASSDIELMLQLLSSKRHDRADRPSLQEARGPRRGNSHAHGRYLRPQHRIDHRHGIVSAIIIRPYFRPAPALLDCDKQILRWPGPFGAGFLSPQPPGAVRIGPVRR